MISTSKWKIWKKNTRHLKQDTKEKSHLRNKKVSRQRWHSSPPSRKPAQRLSGKQERNDEVLKNAAITVRKQDFTHQAGAGAGTLCFMVQSRTNHTASETKEMHRGQVTEETGKWLRQWIHPADSATHPTPREGDKIRCESRHRTHQNRRHWCGSRTRQWSKCECNGWISIGSPQAHIARDYRTRVKQRHTEDTPAWSSSEGQLLSDTPKQEQRSEYLFSDDPREDGLSTTSKQEHIVWSWNAQNWSARNTYY